MPVPTHGWDCETRIWPTHCPDCRENVFFFSCTCGSRVYFDVGHPPWNPHEDRCIRYLVRYLVEVQGMPAAHVVRTVKVFAASISEAIPPDVQQWLETIARGPRASRRVSIVEPGDSTVCVTARVIQVNPRVNFFKRFGYADSAVSRALLHSLINQSHDEIVVESTDTMGDIRRYTCFVPRSATGASDIERNRVVHLELDASSLPGGEAFWMVQRSDRVG